MEFDFLWFKNTNRFEFPIKRVASRAFWVREE